MARFFALLRASVGIAVVFALPACVGSTLPTESTTTTTAAELPARDAFDVRARRRLDVAGAEIRFLTKKAEHDDAARREAVTSILRRAEDKRAAIGRALDGTERQPVAQQDKRREVGASLDELEAMLRSARN